MTTDYGREPVMVMPPMSTAAIEEVGLAVLHELHPEGLERPIALDVLRLVDQVLPQYGIHVYPADPAELQQEEGLTNPAGDGEIEILIREEYWNTLGAGGRRANRAKATVLHELGHAVLHVPVIRRRRTHPNAELLLRRVPAGAIRPFRNPEWQAWTFAGVVAMPRMTLTMLDDLSPEAVAETYQVSKDFARGHLRRLKLLNIKKTFAAKP